MGFPSFIPNQVLNAHFDKNSKGETIVEVSYRSEPDLWALSLPGSRGCHQGQVKTVGTGLKAITTRVYYGKNELSLDTPTEVAANYATGKISKNQLLQLSNVKINGDKVNPNVH